MNFDKAFEQLLGHEGGYSNNPSDPGGETNWGISKRNYPNVNITSLTQEQAKVIYRRDYWLACHLDKLPDEVVFDVFDGAVNSGVSQSIKWLQAAAMVPQDGVIGTLTLKACGVLPGYVLHARYNGHRLEFMTRLKTWPVFSGGWARRIASNLKGI